jgi:hypothetical protein
MKKKNVVFLIETHLAFDCTKLAVSIGRRKYLINYEPLYWNSFLF